jgi:glycerate 2-kinase
MCDAPIATLAVSDVYDDDLAVIGSGPTYARRPRDRAAVIAPMRTFAETVDAEFPPRHNGFVLAPYRDDVERVARAVVAEHEMFELVAWGEPTVRVPDDHGEGGRAQQLALLLARELRDHFPHTSAFVIASDGMDGPAPAHRRAPAGAIVDDKSWERIADEGIDPEQALVHCDAGTALDAIGALVVTGPTGINHGDLIVIG